MPEDYKAILKPKTQDNSPRTQEPPKPYEPQKPNNLLEILKKALKDKALESIYGKPLVKQPTLKK